MEVEAMTLTNSPSIHVGPITTPGSNETISIVIPLSAHLTNLSKSLEKSRKEYSSENFKKQCKTINLGSKDNKSRGCPFPNCNRYGRAFSRSHDLKRHIARHKIRKERLPEISTSETGDCNKCEINFIEDYLKSGSQFDEDGKIQNCNKQIQEINLETPFLDMSKNSEPNFKTQPTIEKSLNSQMLGDEDYLIEDFLLLRNTTPSFSVLPEKGENITSDKTNLAKKLRCDYCSKIFKTKWTLSSHVAAHEGRFQFDCNQCGKKFVRKSHFEGHVRSHETTRPYTCDLCGKTFKELKHRREHIKRKHPEMKNTVQSFLEGANFSMPNKANLDQAKFTIVMPLNIGV